MKKILLSFIAITLFAGLSSGMLSYLNFDIGQFICKVIACSDRESPSERVELTMPVSAFQALPDKTEISLKGKLYDVSKVKIGKGSVSLVLYRDDYEEKLISNIVSLIAQGDHFSDIRDTTRFNKHRSYIPDGKVLVKRFYAIASYNGNRAAYTHSIVKPLIDYCDNNVIKPPPRSIIS